MASDQNYNIDENGQKSALLKRFSHEFLSSYDTFETFVVNMDINQQLCEQMHLPVGSQDKIPSISFPERINCPQICNRPANPSNPDAVTITSKYRFPSR